MTANEAYVRFLTKVNQNLKGSNPAADKTRFVILYNEEKDRFLDHLLDQRNDVDVVDADEFLTTSTQIAATHTTDGIYKVELPTDWHEVSSAYAYGTKGKCKNKRISLYPIKNFDAELVLRDAHNAPSFEYREAPYYVGSGAINIFTDGFVINKGVVTYYKTPTEIGLDGAVNVDGSASTNQDPTESDWFVNRVISLCAESFFRNYGDTNKVAVNKERTISNT